MRPSTARGPVAVLLLVATVAVIIPGCGEDDGQGRSTCGPVAVEEIDPNQGHLLANAGEPEFLTDPPTSGPHIAGLVVRGVADHELTGLEQVSTLETGSVILQHRGLTPAERTELEAMAGDKVVVAEDPGLPAPVVATAWAHKMVCSGFDTEALEAFTGQFVDRAGTHATATSATSTTSTTSTSTTATG